MMKMADGKPPRQTNGPTRSKRSPRYATNGGSISHGRRWEDRRLELRRLDDDRLALGRHRLLFAWFQGYRRFPALITWTAAITSCGVIVIGLS